jgi:hypothetical protein
MNPEPESGVAVSVTVLSSGKETWERGDDCYHWVVAQLMPAGLLVTRPPEKHR